MKVLVVEDEPPIADDILDLVTGICGNNLEKITAVHTFEEAVGFLDHHAIDLCLLDLNLSGRNGFGILEDALSRDFHTIVISAYTDRAIEAFRYGILDFVPKPIDKARLSLAIDRFFGRRKREGSGIRFIIVRKRNENLLVPVDEIRYFRADGYLVEVHRISGQTDLIEKSLNKLEQILPERFIRVHRSCIVDRQHIVSFHHAGNGTYEIRLDNGESLPLSARKRRDIL